MSDERDKKEDPAEELKQGLTHLWRAARGVASEVKKEVERTDFGKAIDGAGREFVRAAANVVDRLADEVQATFAKPRKPDDRREAAPPKEPAAAPPADEDEDEFDGVKPKPRDAAQDGGPRPPAPGAGPPDPGFRIAVDDDAKKKGS